MNEATWQEWVNKFEWIVKIAKRRKWTYEKLKINPPIPERTIKSIEKNLEVVFPQDFTEVLTKYASGVFLDWTIKGEETEGKFREIFCGGGRGYLWDYSILIENYKSYLSWIDACFPDPEDEIDKIWHNKIPFLSVPNGDIIAFGEETIYGNPVVYLSHDGEEDFNGARLGLNFVDFINKWSTLGCIGTEDWQFEPFYDYENKLLKKEGPAIEEWKKWLEKK